MDNSIKLPGTVKAVKIITIVRFLICVAFYAVFSIKDIQLGDVGPQIILYTASAFAVMMVAILYAIKKRNLWLLRGLIVVDLVVALPASAFISVVLSVVSFGITFSKSFKSHFELKIK